MPGIGPVAAITFGAVVARFGSKEVCAYVGLVPRETSSGEQRRGRIYVVTHGTWEQSAQGPDGKPTTLVIRTTEVLKATHCKWWYVVDHASIGVPPPPSRRERSTRPRSRSPPHEDHVRSPVTSARPVSARTVAGR